MHTRLAAGVVIAALLLSAGGARAVEADLGDPDTYAYAQRYLLLQLNQLRGREGAPRVELDPLACQAAKQHAAEMLSGRFLSHWDRRGLKPTRRYNLLGGFHALGENVYRQRGGAAAWRSGCS